MENIIYSLMRCKGRFSLIVRNRKIFVQENVSFTPIVRKSTIGAISYNVHITSGVKFITHDGGTLLFRDRVPDLEITKPIVIGNNVYLGNNVILLPGVTIGNNVVIGAGAVVSRGIPDDSVAVGVPARVVKTTKEYFEKLQKESLHLGHLKGETKDKALMKYYNYQGGPKGYILIINTY